MKNDPICKVALQSCKIESASVTRRLNFVVFFRRDSSYAGVKKSACAACQRAETDDDAVAA